MRSLAHTGPAQRRKSTACACTSTSLWPKIQSAPGATVPAWACSRDADVGSFRFQRMQSHRTCLQVLVSEWSRYKSVRGLRFRRAQFGRRWHRSVLACAVYGMYHLPGADVGRFCRRRACTPCMYGRIAISMRIVRYSCGGCQFQCAISCQCGQFRVP